MTMEFTANLTKGANPRTQPSSPAGAAGLDAGG